MQSDGLYDEDEFYEYADKAYDYLLTYIVKEFNKLKSKIMSFDEVNILSEVNVTYGNLKKITYEKFMELVSAQYEKYFLNGDASYEGINEEWLYELLTEVDEVTKYSYSNELDRTRQRCFEGLIAVTSLENATKSGVEEIISTSMKHYSRMLRQETITLANESAVKAMIDEGDDRVKWITQKDGNVCDKCKKKNGKIYSINKIPSKPHRGCRCSLEPI